MLLTDPDRHFGPENRICKKFEFQEIFAKGAKLVTPFFVLYYRRSTGPAHRLGLTVSRRMGPAVIRNRIKRRFREMFRCNKPLADVHLDLVLNARKPAATASYSELQTAYRLAIRQILEILSET